MRGLFPLSAYSPHGDAQTGTKRGGERPQEQATATTQNHTKTPKSLTAQTEPRYYGQVPIRGCSLMVKPQSSKLITRVRFPSSPRTIPPTLSGGFFVLGDAGNPFRMRICFLARSESARSSSSSPPQIPLKVAGNRLRLKVPKAFETFRLQPVIPSMLSFNDDGNRFRAKMHSLARSESARSSLTYIYFSSTCCAETIVANSSRNAAIL